MNEIQKHLDKNLLHRYRNLQLLPAELLMVDEHLSVCDYCRYKMQEKNDLETLYQTFFESEIEPQYSKFSLKNFEFAKWFNFSANQSKLAFAVVIIFVFIMSISIFYNNQKLLPEIEITNVSQPKILTEEKVIIAPKPENSSELNRPNKPENVTKVLKKPILIKTGKLKNNKLPLLNNNQSNPIKNKETIKNKSVNINLTDIESDSSQIMGSDTQRSVNNQTNLKLTKANNKVFVNVETNKKVSSYQYFIAEMPKLITISKEKNVNKRWQIPHKKLVKGKSYILQIIVTTDDNQSEIIQKAIKY